MKRLLLVFLFAIVTASIGFFASDAYAINPDYGYVVVRCTVTLSIDVLDTNATWFVHGSVGNGDGVAPGTNYISGASSITVLNNSSGALTRWRVHVSTIQKLAAASDPKGGGWAADSGDGVWSLGAAADVTQAHIMAVFKNGESVDADFTSGAGNDDLILRDTDNAADVWSTSRFDPDSSDYGSAIGSGASGIWVSPVSPNNNRALFFKIEAPTAVLDQDWRRFVVVITAVQ